jgi:hypothetical protein
MPSRALVVVALLGLAALAVGLARAAAPQYQFTGTVAAVDVKGKVLSIDKGGEVWDFSTEGLKDLRVKKGDRVTVSYTMHARKVEATK